MDAIADRMDQVIDRLAKLESAIDSLVKRETIKDWYSTDDLSGLLGKAEFTVREWCRLGRIRAAKKGSGRGRFLAWVVSHDELLRIQREGLLPMKCSK